ncbi:hypothetical protein O1611_g2234 [Lasiodiplodia mahajangana]|uniref:Uncharacterized protein n=1 Tax=Lasiodiplodia mahajangana TaxID=1108764 RepID=A0ACC2JV50_9PEZI|nr:hypothetical protein O1611_g2234 [Lasiodiplodia mahajangana]
MRPPSPSFSNNVLLTIIKRILAIMSLPSDSTVIWTSERNGKLMGIFIDNTGQYQYRDGRITNLSDEKAWWPVPDFTKKSGVTQSGYYYVYQRDGYHQCSAMVKQPGGTVGFREVVKESKDEKDSKSDQNKDSQSDQKTSKSDEKASSSGGEASSSAKKASTSRGKA